MTFGYGGTGIALVDGNRGGQIPVGSDVSLQACVELVNPRGFLLGEVAAFDFRLSRIGIEATTHSHVLGLSCHTRQKNRLGEAEKAQRVVYAYHPIGLGTQLSLR